MLWRHQQAEAANEPTTASRVVAPQHRGLGQTRSTMLLPFPPAIRTALLTPNYPTSSRPQHPATTVSGACICSSPYCEFAGGKTVKPTHLTSSSAVATSVPPRTQSTTQYSYYPYCSAHQIKPTPIPPPQIHAQMPKPICKTPTITSPTPCRPRVSRRAHSRRRFVPSQRTDHLPQPFPSCRRRT